MSLLKSLGSIAKKVISSPVVRAVAPVLGGPVGATISALGTAYGAYQALKAPSVGSVGPSSGSTMTLPSLNFSTAGMLSPAAVAGAGRAVMVGARGVAKKAADMCRKYPQWCATIGGTAAVEALMHSGQLPMPKRRRGKGISAHELRAFKRVARFTSRYCAPVHKAMRAPAVRGGKSCR